MEEIASPVSGSQVTYKHGFVTRCGHWLTYGDSLGDVTGERHPALTFPSSFALIPPIAKLAQLEKIAADRDS